jgi:hypothetical protein
VEKINVDIHSTGAENAAFFYQICYGFFEEVVIALMLYLFSADIQFASF